MYALVASRRRHGSYLPRSQYNGSSILRILAKALCSSCNDVRTIDVMENVPATYPSGCGDNKEIKEIVLVYELACVLMKNGIARCYDATNGALLCELNPVDNSTVHFAAVHTVVHNPTNDTLIIAYSCLPSHLQCKVVPIEALRKGKLESPPFAHEFESVVMRHPAFFEFCGTNKRIGAADLYKHVYRFWNMINYKPVFEIKGQGYQELRVSDGVVVMLSQPKKNIIPLSLYDMENGELLATRELKIAEDRELQFLELLATNLLIKQQGCLMRVYDVLNDKGFSVENTIHFRPNGFVFYDVGGGRSMSQDLYESNYSGALESMCPKPDKFAHRLRNFFTISRTCIEFWELNAGSLLRTNKLHIHGMDNPDLCYHSQWANLLFIHAKSQIHSFDSKYDKDILVGHSDRTLCMKRDSLRRRSQRVHTPTKPVGSLNEVDIFSSNIDPDMRQGILLFSLDGKEYHGRIDRDICGPHLRTLSVKHDISLIACGNNSGIMRLVRLRGKRKQKPSEEPGNGQLFL